MDSMKARRGSTSSPIRVVKISSAAIASSIWTRNLPLVLSLSPIAPLAGVVMVAERHFNDVWRGRALRLYGVAVRFDDAARGP